MVTTINRIPMSVDKIRRVAQSLVANLPDELDKYCTCRTADADCTQACEAVLLSDALGHLVGACMSLDTFIDRQTTNADGGVFA